MKFNIFKHISELFLKELSCFLFFEGDNYYCLAMAQQSYSAWKVLAGFTWMKMLEIPVYLWNYSIWNYFNVFINKALFNESSMQSILH